MQTGISFGSLFHQGKIGRSHVEVSLINPKPEIERVKAKNEQNTTHSPLEIMRESTRRNLESPLYAQAALGKSQVKSTPASITLTDEEKSMLNTLSSAKYGFHENSNDFWVHSRKCNKDGKPNLIMGDGKIQEGETRQDFIKGLLSEDFKAFNFAGKSPQGTNVSAFFIRDDASNKVSIYLTENDKVQKHVANINDTQKLVSAIETAIDEIETIYGATIWK